MHKVLKNTPCGLNIFIPQRVKQLEEKVIWKDSKPYVVCLIRNKEILTIKTGRNSKAVIHRYSDGRF